jgi:hypothetical protein
MTYTEQDLAYFQSETDHAKRGAKETIAQYIESNTVSELLYFDAALDEGEEANWLDYRQKSFELLAAIEMLRDDLLAWARDQS